MRLHQALPVLAALTGASLAADKAVFAHYMLGNVASFSQADWEKDIQLAKDSGIDGFALNMAADALATNWPSAQTAFKAAENKNFKLFFSFDYLGGNTPWAAADVTNYTNTWKGSSAYFKRDGRPLVSTFEGVDNRNDWTQIKTDTQAFFMPDYSSLGAEVAAAAPGVDGLFSWDAWPKGASDKTDEVDNYYRSQLGSKPYMMPVSPWFFTNLPDYNKNRLWRGDDLWYDRWQQVMEVKPDYVEIITWNDFGESHYIGPLDSRQYGPFQGGKAPYNYVEGLSHDGWRLFLPYLIKQYKTGSASIDKEGLVTWYRTQPGKACATGGTVGNAEYEPHMEPYDVVQDNIFFSALLNSDADYTVSIDGTNIELPNPKWRNTPGSGAGIYHASVPYKGHRGAVVVTISRNGQQVAQVKGASITDDCQNRAENWNAWVGSDPVVGTSSGTTPPPPTTTAAPPPPSTTTATPPPSDNKPCVEGSGQGNYSGLCSFACGYNYCPPDVCQCTRRDTNAVSPPPVTGQRGYPAIGVKDRCSYLGLCSYAWDHGYTDNLAACGSDPAGAEGCK
ncbi:hypothetical protein PG993_005074 [Apiospora rasikravindrae]|uniref:Uncharacterized protein n=1 Tax=Apiospora rasikravindrae TaxID=990691 RepID=A0ABR1TGJ5_9PEZI